MGRQPCCEKVGLKRGPWAVEEDRKLVNFITRYGHGCWREVPKLAGLLRCGKSCRLRWTNYLRPDLKRGQLSDAEEKLIIDLHAAIGNRWSRIAAQLPGRTDNEIKNYWNTRIRKKLKQMGIDPATHKPLSESFDQQQQKKKINKLINKKLGSSESQLESTNTASTIIKDHGNSQDSSLASGEGKGSVSKATSGAIGLSKKEKMEVESREAHIKVQKMRAALHAFNNSRSSPPSVISSPTSSAITLPHNTGNGDLDDSLFMDPSRVRDSIINNIISAKRPFFKDHPYFPFSQALESSPSSSMQTISQDCYMFENLKERDNVEFNYGNQALRSFVYEDKPHFNDWFSAQTFPEAVGHTRTVQLASMAAPSASSHYYQKPTQEPASYQWKDALGWEEDTKPSMENCSPCSTLHVPSLESSISSSVALAPSSSSGASSWNSIMQQLLEDGSIPCGSLDSKTATLTPGNATFAPSELQHLASLLDEI